MTTTGICRCLIWRTAYCRGNQSSIFLFAGKPNYPYPTVFAPIKDHCPSAQSHWLVLVICLHERYKKREGSEKDLLEFANIKIERCQFAPAIKRWQRHFASAYFFVGFYDKLCEKSLEFYQEICQFLEIDPKRTPDSVLVDLAKVVNPGISRELPAHLSLHMALGWQAGIEELIQLFTHYPQKWKRLAEEIFAKGSLHMKIPLASKWRLRGIYKATNRWKCWWAT